MASIYEIARQRIACATIKAPTKKVTLSECGHLRNEASKKWRDEHKEIYNARMRAYRKKQKEKLQAQNH